MEPRDYGPFPYTPINDRPTLKWPNGARLAVWIIPNIEFFLLTRSIPGRPYTSHAPVPSVRSWAQRDCGNRVGIWRVMEVLQKYGVRASPTLNSDICDHHPQIVKAAVELGWEILGHNETNSLWLNQMEPEEERQSIGRTLSKIAGLIGKKPRGWLGAGLAETWHTLDYLADEGVQYVADWGSGDPPFFMDFGGGKRPRGWLGAGLAETWHTLDYLADEGVQYVADWVSDDQPFFMDIGGGKRLVSIPYSYEINDSPFLYTRNGTIELFVAAIKRQFDTLNRAVSR